MNSRTHRFKTTFILALAAWSVASQPSSSTSDLVIAAISIQGTNVVLAAAVPAGMSQVILEMQSAPNAGWTEAGSLDAPAAGGQLTFTISKPGDAQLFRLKGKPLTANSNLFSPELNYVTTASLGPIPAQTVNGKEPPSATEAMFHFNGFVDGSDRIVITHQGALWEHAHWHWPDQNVNVNGTVWYPREKNYLTTTGSAKFLPDTFSLDSAKLEVIDGRDLVVVERVENALIVHLNDTPPGAAEYQFKIHFYPPQPKSASAGKSVSATLKIAADIDGSDCLKITATEATWEHKTWGYPENVTLNGIAWDPRESKVLTNGGPTKFLPSGIDFSTARIASRKGRDLATMWAENDSVTVWFADNPNDRGAYEIEISFGQ